MSLTFDSLGMPTSCHLQSKRIVQQLLKQNIDWDEPIPNSLLKQREFWKEDLQFIFDVNIPRWFGIKNNLTKELSLIYSVTPPQKLMAL